MTTIGKNWSFTMNNMEEMKPFEETGASYMVYQEEIAPSTQQHHYQGFMQFPTNKRLSALKKVFPGAHWTPMTFGSVDAMAQYCKKEATRAPDTAPIEHGVFVIKGSSKRKLRTQYDENPTALAEEDPKAYRRIVATVQQEVFQKEYVFPHSKKPWQLELESLIEKPANDRDIIWVYGKKGAEGKSTYAKLLASQGWFYHRGGKSMDIFYEYGPDIERNIVFDIPRSKQSYIQYDCIEIMKDGMISSGKYEPLNFRRRPGVNVHCVVMANFLPQYEEVKTKWDPITRREVVTKSENNTLSKDRVVIIQCKKECPPILMPYRSPHRSPVRDSTPPPKLPKRTINIPSYLETEASFHRNKKLDYGFGRIPDSPIEETDEDAQAAVGSN